MMTETMKPGKVLKNEQFGSPINLKLSNYLKKYTSRDNWADVSHSKGMSTSTIRDLVYRRNSLTEENSKVIIALVEVAIVNCERFIKDAVKAKKELKEMIQ